MRKPRTGHLVFAVAVSLSALGCHGRDTAPYPTWAPTPTPYAPQAQSGNAFDGYALAALSVEATGGKHLTRVSFYPDQKKAAMAVCEPAIAQIARASQLPCDFRFVPRTPFSAAPYQQGWRLIGRSLRWKIEGKASARDFDGAITYALLATRFGFDLTGGGATDASLGYVIADDARTAIAPWLTKMGAAQLERLSKGVSEALARKPGVRRAIEHESENIRLAVQTLQDAFQKDDFKAISENLGPDSREAINYLQGLRDKDDKRVAFFNGFAAEGDAEIKYLTQSAGLPAAKRPKEPKFEESVERPWKRFAHHFFMTGRPLLEMDDRSLARTRLLVLNADLVRIGKVVKSYPRDLRSFPVEIKTDPYSGDPFLYRQDGAQYEIYSVGANLRDDAGDTDETFTTPDLKLEAGG
jgi:hypothetical protein